MGNPYKHIFPWNYVGPLRQTSFRGRKTPPVGNKPLSGICNRPTTVATLIYVGDYTDRSLLVAKRSLLPRKTCRGNTQLLGNPWRNVPPWAAIYPWMPLLFGTWTPRRVHLTDLEYTPRGAKHNCGHFPQTQVSPHFLGGPLYTQSEAKDGAHRIALYSRVSGGPAWGVSLEGSLADMISALKTLPGSPTLLGQLQNLIGSPFGYQGWTHTIFIQGAQKIGRIKDQGEDGVI